MKSWQQRERALRHPLEGSRLRAASRTATGCASRWRFPTPTGSGCRTSASRRSTGCSTPRTTSSASACSCRRSRSWPSCSRRATPLVTLESQTPVGDFDVFAFSVSFEWDYTNVLTLLRLAGIPPRAAERTHAPSAGRDRRRGDVREPRAAGAVRRRDRRRRRRGADSRRCVARVQRRHRSRRSAARCSPPSAASTCRRSTTSQYAADGTIAGFVPRAGTGAPPSVRKAALKTTDAVDPPATSIFTPDTEFGSRFLDRGRARLRQPVPLLLGRLQLPAGARVSRPSASSSSPRRRAPHSQPRRPGVDRALRPSRTSSASSRGCTRWATRSARRRCGSTI